MVITDGIVLNVLHTGDDVSGVGSSDGRAARLRWCRQQGGGSSGNDARHAVHVRWNADGSVHWSVFGVVRRRGGTRQTEQHRQRTRSVAIQPSGSKHCLLTL